MDYNKLKTYASKVKEEQRGLDRKIVAKVVGVTFEGRQEIVGKLQRNTELELERDRRNEYDFYAVKVMAHLEGEWVQVGFLPRRIARLVSQSLDAGQNLKVELIKRTGGGTTEDGDILGFGLDVRIIPEG